MALNFSLNRTKLGRFNSNSTFIALDLCQRADSKAQWTKHNSIFKIYKYLKHDVEYKIFKTWLAIKTHKCMPNTGEKQRWWYVEDWKHWKI